MIINFMLGVFECPKKNYIYTSVEGARNLARKWPYPVDFRHVGHDLNVIADDMVRRSREQRKSI